MRPLVTSWATRVVAASLLNANGAGDLAPIVIKRFAGNISVRMRFALVGIDAAPESAVWGGEPLEAWATGSIDDGASGSKLDGDEVALVRSTTLSAGAAGAVV
mmetsp:Transcript_23318/g.74688  ORF Transcript_23318/g.74688 Transcript_23318/m.74688 type:complete len:103 (-) Transcript_23318:28-336(-)